MDSICKSRGFYEISNTWNFFQEFIINNYNLNEKLNSGFGPNARVNSI